MFGRITDSGGRQIVRPSGAQDHWVLRQFSDQHIAALSAMVVGAGIWTVRYGLPLQLTDVVSAVSVLALWTQAAMLVELAYFWAFTASLQALLTPDLAQSFPSVFYFTYFTYHVGAVIAASFLVFGCRLYPRPEAVWRVYWVTLGFTAVAEVGNVITGGNYMYLREKPAHSSLLSRMSPWPWYIVQTAILGLLLLLAVAGLTRAVRAVLADTVEAPRSWSA